MTSGLEDTQPATPASGEPARPLDALPSTISRFRVRSKLGEGGNGVVLLAEDPTLGRNVAIKVLRPGGEPARLLREAQSTAKLTHENVVVVHEVGTFDDQVYVAMEYVAGTTLTRWQVGRPWRACLDMYLRAGRGLAAAHAAGLVHRDFKPDNVLVADDGRVRVTDFGLVCVVGTATGEMPAGDTPLTASLTKTGTVMGTPRYMAPEQHAGEAVDARTDQFAFCVALYEALYGTPPFAGTTYSELVDRVLAGDVTPPPAANVPVVVRDAVLRGLSPRRDDRFPSMNDLLDVLRVTPARRRRRWIPIAAIVAGLAIVASAIIVIATQRDKPTESIEDAYHAGEVAYRARDFPKAIAAFKRMFALDPTLSSFQSTAAMYNIAQSYRLSGNCREAIIAYKTYLAATAGKTKPEIRAQIDRLMPGLEECAAHQGSATN